MNQQGNAVAGQVPEKIAQRAGQKRMGALLAHRKGSNPWLIIGVAVLAMIAAIGAITALNALDLRVPTLRMIAIGVLVIGPLFILYVAVSGTEKTYLFERGMVVVKGVITKDVTWPEVSEVIVNKAPSDGMLEGATLAYVLRCGNGKKVAIEGGDENDRVGPQLTRLLSNAGFVVAPGHVATCAHVVSAALAADPSDPRAPAGEVALDFPFAGLPVVRARVKAVAAHRR